MSSNTPNSPSGSNRPYNDLPSYSSGDTNSGPQASGSGPARFKPGAPTGSGGSAYGSAPGSQAGPQYGASGGNYGGGDYGGGEYGSRYGSSNAGDMASPAPAQNQSPAYTPSTYSQPAYGAPAPRAMGTNGLSIASLVSGIVALLFTWPFGIVGLAPVIMGHIAVKQCKERGQDGKGMAIAGLVMGYVAIAGFLLIVGIIIFAMVLAGTASTY